MRRIPSSLRPREPQLMVPDRRPALNPDPDRAAGRQASPTVEQALAAARRDLELHARNNLAAALTNGTVVADRLVHSTAALLAWSTTGERNGMCATLPRSVRHGRMSRCCLPDITVWIERPAMRTTQRSSKACSCPLLSDGHAWLQG
jgi:thymidylate kinase